MQIIKPIPETDCYYYHLGSSSFITDANGIATQCLQYLPYGETFINQQTNSFQSRYTFSGKEKDIETDYSYFGARYYNSDISIWLSVDPLADKYPSLSPYMYCAANPVVLVDPDGRNFDEWEVLFKNNGTIKVNWISDMGGENVQIVKFSKENSQGDHIQLAKPIALDVNKNDLTNALERNNISVSGIGQGQYPIDNPYISSDYGMRNGSMHNGVDFVNKQRGAVDGKPVYSVTDGKIVRLVTTPDGNRAGVRVRILASSGYQYNYFHLQNGSNLHLKNKMNINKGDVIGNVGNTGASRGAHLHFEIWDPNGNKVNPYNIYPSLYKIPHRK